MIKVFRDKDAERIFGRQYVKRWSKELQQIAYRKLLILDAAESLEDLKIPPGNRLEKLSGDREGQHSIRINHQWRICFVFKDGDVYQVEITDYH
jgi:proteic killer suppression protein